MFGARTIRSQLLRATGLMHPEVVIFDITHRCTSRCAGCAFREPEVGELPAQRWVQLAREARAIGYREIMVTGGEPLAHPDISTILPGLARELPVALMTNGLALRKHVALVREHAARVFVSWDAATDGVYERIRGVRGLTALREGVHLLAGHHAHARVTVWAENIPELASIRTMAREAGCTEMSLLASDTTSAGFGERTDARGTRPRADQLPELRAFLDSTKGDPFVVMSDYSKARLLLLSNGEVQAPRCTAPWTSGVVGPTGRWHHCFFIASNAHAGEGLGAAARSARRERRELDVGTNPTCARCVCWRA